MKATRGPAAKGAEPARGRSGGAAPPALASAIGNQALQQHLHSGTLRAKLTVGGADDPVEAEADRFAARLIASSPAPCHCGGVCPSCRGNAPTIRRKAIGADVASARGDVFANRPGRVLAPGLRSFFEPRLDMSLAAVRVHDDDAAAATARQIGARAFTLGTDIGFGTGGYRPTTPDGLRLLAHELAHVAQAGGLIRRQPVSDQTAQPADPARPAGAEPLPVAGSVDQRVDAFKKLVKTTAVHRLAANRRNLGLWSDAITDVVPAGDVSALGLLQGGGGQPYFELQDIADPGIRDLRAAQTLGHFRACTGCHMENYLWGTREQRRAASFDWQTPNQMRAGAMGGAFAAPQPVPFFSMGGQGGTGVPAAGGFFPSTGGPPAYRPPAGSYEARVNQLYPDPAATRAAMDRMRQVVAALGPDGYQVLPGNMTATLETDGPEVVRRQILAAIVQRQADYLTLIGKIDAGEVGYEHFGPIIQTLLPVVDPEVRAAIQKEMDDHAFWAKVEAFVVATLTAAALILTIFPPTTVFGIALLASLDVTLGVYAFNKGQEMQRIGSAYSLGTGANDVFSPEQQAMGDTMVLMGFISTFTGGLGAAGGLARVDAALGELSGVTTLATSGAGAIARTIQRGEFVTTIGDDGAWFVTNVTRPDLLIVVRGDTATLYQLMPGGSRIIATATVPRAGVGAATPLLGAGPEAAASTALIPAGPQALTAPFGGQAGAGAFPALPPYGILGAGPESGAASTALVPFAPRPLATSFGGAAADLLPGAVAGAPGRVLVPPPPRVPPLLGPGNPTTYTWEQISRMRQPRLWQERETYLQQVYGAPGQQHFPVPGTGGRYVDVPALPLAGEVKSYTRWITVEGQAQRNVVRLTDRIQEQINRDVWLRDNVPGYDPRWMFTDAPPDAALRQALYDARIVFIVHGP